MAGIPTARQLSVGNLGHNKRAAALIRKKTMHVEGGGAVRSGDFWILGLPHDLYSVNSAAGKYLCGMPTIAVCAIATRKAQDLLSSAL
ncbi:MAG TPA: hypothetical protein VKX49_29275 [Bryobacteraceae bacterium]|nr:hypothetical protein [Bryobacteraceae bacterium]